MSDDESPILTKQGLWWMAWTCKFPLGHAKLIKTKNALVYTFYNEYVDNSAATIVFTFSLIFI